MTPNAQARWGPSCPGPASPADALAPPGRRCSRMGESFKRNVKDETFSSEPTMAELRSVDPRSLTPNPNNPRTSPVPKEMDLQLVASITAIGLLQPPLAREIDGSLVIRAGDRRTKAAIAAGKELIDVYVLDGNEDIDAMAAMSENPGAGRDEPGRHLARHRQAGTTGVERGRYRQRSGPAQARRAEVEAARLAALPDAGLHGEGQHAGRGTASHDRQRPTR